MIDKTFTDIKREVLLLSSTMLNFINNHIVNKQPLKLNEDKSTRITILSMIENEKQINSHKLGLKGRIDTIFKCKLEQKGKIEVIQYMPFELKTGNYISTSHYGQTLLYSLLLQKEWGME